MMSRSRSRLRTFSGDHDKYTEEKMDVNVNKNRVDKDCIVLYGKDNRILTTLKIPSNIPKSIVLIRNKSLKKQLHVLYAKYIATGSDHELNISGTNRKKLKEIFETESNVNILKDEELINCMDLAALQILMLLQDPYNRYQSAINDQIEIVTKD